MISKAVGVGRECYQVKVQHNQYGTTQIMTVSVLVDFPDLLDGFGKAIEFAKAEIDKMFRAYVIVSVERLFSVDEKEAV